MNQPNLDVRSPKRYALVTAAYNEEGYIEKTIQSVIAQTIVPERWIVVSDRSTDGTDEIVRRYAASYPFIELVRRDGPRSHDFSSKSGALNAGLRLARQADADFIGILDGDVSFSATYFADLMDKFRLNPALGVGGGWILEESGGEFRPRTNNSTSEVAGAVQLFRRQCQEAVGDFLPLRYGGADGCALVTARMRGWQVQSFPDLGVQHHRTSGNNGRLRYHYRRGLMDFSVGSHPLYEIARVSQRLRDRPLIVAACTRLCGYLRGYVRGEEREVSKEFVKFLREEEIHKLRRFTRTVPDPRVGAGKAVPGTSPPR